MAKSSRASSVKANNQRLKKNVFGPVEDARNARLSAKLLELAAQPKPQKDAEMEEISDDAEAEKKEKPAKATEEMEVDAGSKPSSTALGGKKRIEKRRVKKRSSIVFPNKFASKKSTKDRK